MCLRFMQVFSLLDNKRTFCVCVCVVERTYTWYAKFNYEKHGCLCNSINPLENSHGFVHMAGM